MMKKIGGFGIVLVFGALLTAGCANKEAVKSDEPVAPATATNPAVASEQAAAAQPGAKPVAESVPATPQVQPEQAGEAAKQAAPEASLSLESVYFDFDRAVLKPEALTALEKNFAALKEKDTKVRIEGNCDERGADEYNLALGDRRARSAKDFLVKRGIAADRVETISYGKEHPVAEGHDDAAWSKNRRDDFVIVK